MVMSFPSRTVATIPQPQEQKLHEVVNSLTSESFIALVAARAAGTSTRPARVSPPAPRKPSPRRSRRLTRRRAARRAIQGGLGQTASGVSLHGHTSGAGTLAGRLPAVTPHSTDRRRPLATPAPCDLGLTAAGCGASRPFRVLRPEPVHPGIPRPRGARFSPAMSDSPVRLVPETPPSSPEVPHLRGVTRMRSSAPSSPTSSTPAGRARTGPPRMTGSWPSRMAVRDRLAERWVATQRRLPRADVKRAYYLSAEYLLGRALGNNLHQHRACYDAAARGAAARWASTSTALLEMEPDAGLGNGGLGRLAACFLDSLATLGMPGIGYGIRYEFGIFTPGHRRRLPGGARRRVAASSATPGRSSGPEKAVPVRFYGTRRAAPRRPTAGRVARWVGGKTVLGVPYDTPDRRLRQQHRQHAAPVAGARVGRSSTSQLFNDGDYERAVRGEERLRGHLQGPLPERPEPGRQGAAAQAGVLLRRLLASRDIVRRYLKTPHGLPRSSPNKVAIQLNDTHPAIAVAELMRVLVDEKRLPWDEAWEITVSDLRLHQPHAARRGAGEVAGGAVRAAAAAPPGDHLRDQPALPAPGADPLPVRRRAAARACRSSRRARRSRSAWRTSRWSGSHSVNGVAALHTELLQARRAAATSPQMYPERFNNKTNGVTPAALAAARATRGSSKLITARIGDGLGHGPRAARASWSRSRTTPSFAPGVPRGEARQQGRAGAARARRDAGCSLDPDAIFDVQVKRLHEYKRQLLNALHIVRAVDAGARRTRARVRCPRAFLFGAKAAPGYQHGEADHPADQRHRRGGQQRRRRAPGCRWCSSPTTGCRWPSASSPPPTSPSRSPPPAWRPRAPAT